MNSHPSIPDLQNALVTVFPDAVNSLVTAEIRKDSILLAYAQTAWRDISWGWQPIAECPQQVYSWQPRYRICPLGGRFYEVSQSIGD